MKSVEEYITSREHWSKGLQKIRAVLLAYPLEECIKWNAPVYMAHGRKLIGMAAFKHHFGIWFYEGASLEDRAGILENAQEGKTKYLRQWKLKDVSEIDTELLKQYIEETLEKAGKNPPPKPARPQPGTTELPEIMREAFKESRELRDRFGTFPAYKQKEFVEHLTEAKRESTRLNRLEKIKGLILKGEGLNDKYR